MTKTTAVTRRHGLELSIHGRRRLPAAVGVNVGVSVRRRDAGRLQGRRVVTGRGRAERRDRELRLGSGPRIEL
jgi:hypothetical protein